MGREGCRLLIALATVWKCAELRELMGMMRCWIHEVLLSPTRMWWSEGWAASFEWQGMTRAMGVARER